jgi:hypothetical protein
MLSGNSIPNDSFDFQQSKSSLCLQTSWWEQWAGNLSAFWIAWWGIMWISTWLNNELLLLST